MAGNAGSIVCPACGAGVSKADAACPYCGAEVVLPKPIGMDGPAERRTFCTRCGRLYADAAIRCSQCPPSDCETRGGRCPRCSSDLEPITLGRVTVDRCRQCRGHWFDGDEVEHAIDVTTEGISREDALSARRTLPTWDKPLEEIRYLACVRCTERMVRRQIAPRVGVIVDICRFHGVWFDQGEFEHFAAFSRAGGLEVVRFDGIAMVEAKRVRAFEKAPVWVGPPIESYEAGLWMDLARALGRMIGRIR